MCWDLFVLQPLMAQENAEGGKQKISKPVDINMRFERVFTHRNFYPLSYRGPQNDGIGVGMDQSFQVNRKKIH